MKGFFVTATGTDIGKTWVSRMLAEGLYSKGISVSYCKPVQTGCTMPKAGTLSAPDFDFVRQCGILSCDNHALCSLYRFVPAVSPHLAARMAGTEISLQNIIDSVKTVYKLSDSVIVEGAGGLYAPLTDKTFMIDLAQNLKLPVILVTSPGLGTLNHTILSIRAIKEKNISLAGVIINDRYNIDKDDMYCENCRFITEFADNSPVCVTGPNQTTSTAFKEFCNDIARKWL